MTVVTLTDSECDRCGADLTDDLVRAMDEGGPMECSHCHLAFEADDNWLVKNGYEPNPETDDDADARFQARLDSSTW